jgi:hypothetical protein
MPGHKVRTTFPVNGPRTFSCRTSLGASHILKVRRAFIHCLQAVLDTPHDELVWKRLCFLPTVLFIDIGKCRRADLDFKINLILADTWPFLVGDFPGRMTKPAPAQFSRAQARDSQSTAASACAQVIGSDRDPEKPQNSVLGIKKNIPNTETVLGILFQDHDGIFY